MNLTKKKKKGFTLIELMAVIAIIAILAAVLVPTVTGYINRSKKTAITTQVRTAVMAIESYNATADKDNRIPDNAYLLTLVKPADTEGDEIPEGSKLLAAELLSEKDIDRLNGMTVSEAIKINADTQALDKIRLANDGTIDTFDGNKIKPTPQGK